MAWRPNPLVIIIARENLRLAEERMKLGSPSIKFPLKLSNQREII